MMLPAHDCNSNTACDHSGMLYCHDRVYSRRVRPLMSPSTVFSVPLFIPLNIH